MELKNKLIIRNYTDLSDYECLEYVQSVINTGKISQNKGILQYCFVTTFKNGVVVSVDRRTKSGTNTFYVYRNGD